MNTEGAITDYTIDVEEDLGVEQFEGENENKLGHAFGGNGGIRANQFALRSSLPSLKLNVPLSINSNDIFEVFSLVSKKEKFQVIEME